MEDELFDVRTSFYLGNYHGTISHAANVRPSDDEVEEERDAFVFRAYVAQGQCKTVLHEVTEASPLSSRAVRALALYRDSSENSDAVIDMLNGWLSGPEGTNTVVRLVAGTVFADEQNWDEALRSLQGSNLELLNLSCQVYLKMNLVDRAAKVVQKMTEIDEDDPLTQLALAAVALFKGKNNIQEALYVYKEQIEKFGDTVLLLNGLAVAHMAQGLWEEAESHLLEAQAKNPKDPSTLSNLIVVSRHLGRSNDAVQRNLRQLIEVAPEHAYSADLASAHELFDRSALKYGS